MQELAASIREHGVVQPVIVRPAGDGYELVAGERRLRAAKLAGLRAIPAVIREVSDAEALEIALIENLQREDLNPLEQAEAYRRLVEEFGLGQEEVSKQVGKSRPHVSNMLRLLQLGPEVQSLVRAGRLSMGHARALLALENTAVQKSAAERMLVKGMSVREAEVHVSALMGRTPREQKGRREARREPQIEDLEARLRNVLGTRVKITGGGARGKLEIHYFSAEELERVSGMLLGGFIGAPGRR
jgi:ParB family chromosome partitioning protein